MHSHFYFKKGFTLLEVLIAMAISALIYIGAYGLLDSVLTTNERVSEKRIALQEIQRCFHVMQQDIEQIINRSVRAEFGEPVEALIYSSMDDRLEFTRLGWRNPINRPRSNLQRVAYFLEDGALYRQHWLVLDRGHDSSFRKNELLKGVESMRIRFYDPVQSAWVNDWADAPLASSGEEARGPLPLAIEVTLKTKSYGELIRIFRLVNPSSESIQAGST